MRTTLNISAEAMARVRQLAQQRGATLGEIASELILKAVQPSDSGPVRNGVPLFYACDGDAPDLELFWPDDVSLRTGLGDAATARLHGHRQITDFHLTALAARRGGRLATFDGRQHRSLAGTPLAPVVALVR